MVVYRIAHKNYIENLSGIGAKRYGGRWNNIGKPLVYTSQNISLALLEIMCHLPMSLIKNHFYIAEINLGQTKILTLDKKDLPANWKQNIATTAKLGDNFIDKTTHAVLKVPSAVIDLEFNYLLNPNVNNFTPIINNITPLNIDERLINYT